VASNVDHLQIAASDCIYHRMKRSIGIDGQYADQVFVMFKRLNGRDFAGNGIGLAICKSIVERHGGRIWFESRPHQGTTFFFSYPLRPVVQAELTAPQNSQKVAAV